MCYENGMVWFSCSIVYFDDLSVTVEVKTPKAKDV